MAKYGPKAHEAVEREMKEMKEGKLRSGSGQKVTNPKQAIAIALSEARRAGAKMPPAPEGTASAAKEGSDRKAAAKKAAAKKSPAKKTAPKKAGTKKAGTKKATAKESPAKKAPASEAAGKKASARPAT